MKSLTCLALLLIASACSDRAERPSIKKGDIYSDQAAIPDSKTDDIQKSEVSDAGSFTPADPNKVASNGEEFPKIEIKLTDVPSGTSDIYAFTANFEADAAISHYAYKFDSPENCGKANSYKVETAKTPLAVNVEALADGKVAICLLAYYFPKKQWMAPADALVYSWDKIQFKRKISAAYEEYDAFCDQIILTQTEIEFTGNVGIYTWVRDAEAQGCDEATERGKDVINIQSNDDKEIKGFWAFGGGDVSGWFHFVWSDAARTTFTGTYGYGEPGLNPEGNWNSK